MATETTRLDQLVEEMSNGSEYPRNVFEGVVHEHSLKALEAQLNIRSDKLFCHDSKAAVEFFELYRHSEGYHSKLLNDFETLNAHLTLPVAQHRPDPRRRFIFINAPNSRAQLRVTRGMFLQLLTYHQVMPSFLHYVFPFGAQHYVRDFHFMGFRGDSYIQMPNPSLEIPQLLRSGLNIELCYSLKSVERSIDAQQPWAIRQCSLHHRYDLQTEQMSWIVIKANRLIQRAIESQCRTEHQADCRAGSRSPLLATLAVHRILATWAGENWHWYISDLESDLQEKTRRTLYIPLETTKSGTRPTRSNTWDSRNSPKSAKRRTFSLRSFSEFIKRSSSISTWSDDPTITEEPCQLSSPAENSETPSKDAVDDFSFEDFQEVQRLEDRANETLLVLKANSRVINDLRREYSSLLTNSNCPTLIKSDCHSDLIRFDQDLSNVDKDLIMQQSRVEALLRMLSDRKSLIQGILQFRNMEASKTLAQKAQESAERMEDMTVEMHAIAQKTKIETVSMRIITVVTLFFLPGTFISTLMSTPIVKFDSTHSGFSSKNIGVGALQLYLVISIPLVLLTFFAWFLVKRRTRQAEERFKASEKGEV